MNDLTFQLWFKPLVHPSQLLKPVVQPLASSHMKGEKTRAEMPQVKTKVVYRYRTQDGKLHEITVSSWRCNYPITQRTKCPRIIEGPNSGPVQQSGEQHWQRHLDGKPIQLPVAYLLKHPSIRLRVNSDYVQTRRVRRAPDEGPLDEKVALKHSRHPHEKGTATNNGSS